MENDRVCSRVMIIWFQYRANITISGWQQSKICILLLYLDFQAYIGTVP